MPELNMNMETIEPVGSFEPIPVGDYKVIISASEKKSASTGRGEYLQFTYDIVEGDYKGRKLFDRLNIVNDTPTAQKIAQSKLSAICHILGILRPKMTEELHDKPFIVSVAIRPAKGEYSASNEVRGYKYPDGRTIKEVLGGSVPVSKNENTAVGGGLGKKPWEKK